jgi:molybdopterin-binding protein
MNKARFMNPRLYQPARYVGKIFRNWQPDSNARPRGRFQRVVVRFFSARIKLERIKPKKCVFETWANCGKESTMSTSIRNRLPGTIEKIVSDNVVSELVIRTAAGDVTSIITTGSVKRMNLKEGDNVFAIIKATEVSVEKE